MTDYSVNKVDPLSTSETDFPRCEQDGYPMLEIDGQLECVAEYLDRCIAGQPVVDIVQSKKTVYYVFANGHKLPMLCSCCGKPLVYPDLEEARQDVVGKRLESMSINPDVSDDGREVEELVLGFSATAEPGILEMPVSFTVAAQMRHPANCPHRPRSTSAKSSRKKKRRYRGLPGRN